MRYDLTSGEQFNPGVGLYTNFESRVEGKRENPSLIKKQISDWGRIP